MPFRAGWPIQDAVAPRRSSLLVRMRDERGIALVLALGMTAALAVSVTAVLLFTSANSRESSRSLADQQAHALAEAALANARDVLYNSTEPLNPSSVPETTTTYPTGTATHVGELSDSIWTLTGTGAVRNPTGGADVTRTLTSRVAVGGGSGSPTGANAVWNYVYSDSLTTCSDLKNSATIDVPVYVRGDLCMSNSSRITADIVQVGGVVSFTNSASIGTALVPIQTARIGTGCQVSGGAVQACSASTRVYANEITSAPEGLVKPPVDLDRWYADAKPGPNYTCASLEFDNDGELNRSLSTVDLAPESAYDCEVVEDGDVVGRLAWTPGSPGTLEIEGTIFFDGDILFDDTDAVVYDGRGTIYASGKITFSNYATVCGVAACDATWNASTDLLAFVAGKPVGNDAFLIQNQAMFQGAVYAVGDFREQNNGVVWGPIIADSFDISNSGLNHSVPLGTLLQGMPSNASEVTVLSNVEEGFGE
jgi:Tfp pilus assembly protein PilX